MSFKETEIKRRKAIIELINFIQDHSAMFNEMYLRGFEFYINKYEYSYGQIAIIIKWDGIYMDSYEPGIESVKFINHQDTDV